MNEAGTVGKYKALHINAESIKKAVPFLGLIILFILFGVTTNGAFIQMKNIRNIISQVAITMVAGIGCSFVMSHNNLDFSLGGACAMSAVVAFVVASKVSYALLLPVCLIVGMLCGLFTAVLHIKARIPAFMAGMCIMFAGRGLAQGVYAQYKMILPISFKPLQDVKFYLMIALITFLAAYLLFNYTKIGKYNRLIGSNPRVAHLSGIPVNKYKTIAFIISGCTVGIAAFLSIIRGSGVGASTGMSLETNVLIALTLGGFPLTGGSQSRMRSIVLGALTLFVLNNGLTLWGVDPSVIYIIKGVIFLAVVYISVDRAPGTIMI